MYRSQGEQQADGLGVGDNGDDDEDVLWGTSRERGGDAPAYKVINFFEYVKVGLI